MNDMFNPPFLGEIRRPHFSDESINVGQFCKSFKDEVTKEINDGARRNAPESVLSVSMEMSENAVNEVSKICSINQLTCENEPLPLNCQNGPMPLEGGSGTPAPVLPGMRGARFDPAAARRLRSLRMQKLRMSACNARDESALAWYRQTLRYYYEYRLKLDHRPLSWGLFSMRSFTALQPVVTVRVYMPSPPPSKDLPSTSARNLIRLSQEITCLGSNMLAQLRDKITCSNDEAVVNDCSVSISTKPIAAKTVYPSGFFCINRVFYLDGRHEGTLDYSQPIREWAEKHPHYKGAKFDVVSMETTSLGQLTVRPGYPYIYVHQGRCQHLISFSDIRLMHPRDPSQRSLYPIVTAVRPFRVHPCDACDRAHASWVALEHNLTPMDPTYFCEDCYRGFNFSRNKKQRFVNTEFKAYPCYRSEDAAIE